MTAPKNYLQIGSREWNVLLAHNAAELVAFFQKQPTPTPESYGHIVAHMDRMKEILPGWLASAPPVAQEPVSQQGQDRHPVSEQANGAAPKERKKGGWPLGKPRTRKAQQAVQ